MKTPCHNNQQKEANMFIRCTFFKTVPGKEEEVKALYLKEVIPHIKKEPGLIEVRLLEPADKADDFISITEWKTRADAEAYDSSGLYQQLVSKFEGLFTKLPVLKVYNSEQQAVPAL